LSYIVLEYLITSEYPLGRFSSQRVYLLITILVYYKILNISLDPVKSYSSKVINHINYLGCFYSEQVLVEKNINIY
jgi:hypothetical protein